MYRFPLQKKKRRFFVGCLGTAVLLPHTPPPRLARVGSRGGMSLCSAPSQAPPPPRGGALPGRGELGVRCVGSRCERLPLVIFFITVTSLGGGETDVQPQLFLLLLCSGFLSSVRTVLLPAFTAQHPGQSRFGTGTQTPFMNREETDVGVGKTRCLGTTSTAFVPRNCRLSVAKKHLIKVSQSSEPGCFTSWGSETSVQHWFLGGGRTPAGGRGCGVRGGWGWEQWCRDSDDA